MKTKKTNHGYEHLSQHEAQKLTSVRERYCMENFITNLNKKYKYKRFEFTPSSINAKIAYDGELKIYDNTNNLIGYCIVEIKVREDLHRDYIFEKKKKEALLKAKEEKDLMLKIKNIDFHKIMVEQFQVGNLLLKKTSLQLGLIQ
jgi:small nuclear ribonucleoprotein (snRNP)-like protein